MPCRLPRHLYSPILPWLPWIALSLARGDFIEFVPGVTLFSMAEPFLLCRTIVLWRGLAVGGKNH
jgi:hypothetical protein